MEGLRSRHARLSYAIVHSGHSSGKANSNRPIPIATRVDGKKEAEEEGEEEEDEEEEEEEAPCILVCSHS